jgi:hypothetical protein
VDRRRSVELAPGETGLGADGAGLGIDVDAFHGRQVDHQAAVGHRLAGDLVAAAAHRDLEFPFPGEVDGVDDIGGGQAAGDQRRALVDEPVVDVPGIVIAVAARLDQRPAERHPQFVGHGHGASCVIHPSSLFGCHDFFCLRRDVLVEAEHVRGPRRV